ncbi:MAG: flagellar biosynthesis anti-sigma factor FlgM [Terriglobales bacterium]
MRVDLTTFGLEPPENGKPSRAGQNGAAGTVATSSSSAADQASLSFDQARVKSLEAQVLAQPEVRGAKVQSLQQAISSGEYTVSAGQVADAMTSELTGSQG